MVRSVMRVLVTKTEADKADADKVTMETKPVQEMVNHIVLRLRELMGDDESGFRNYFEMLETLAENRDLQPESGMADSYDEKSLPCR
jgi:hypothetical protein